MTYPRRLSRLVLVVCALVAQGALPAAADEENDKTLTAPQSNIDAAKLKSVEAIAAQVTAAFDGHILEIELEQKDIDGAQKWVYDVKVLTRRGHILKLLYDAQSGQLLKTRGRWRKPHEHESHGHAADDHERHGHGGHDD